LGDTERERESCVFDILPKYVTKTIVFHYAIN
jgi:hypothetical protein